MKKTAFFIIVLCFSIVFTIFTGCIESHVTKTETVITKLDSSQNVQWTVVIENTNYSSARSSTISNRIIRTSDNGYLIAGEFSDKTTGNNSIRLIKTNGYGEPEWEKQMGTGTGDLEFLTLVQRPDNGYSAITRHGHGYNFDVTGTLENVHDISGQINPGSQTATRGKESPPVSLQSVTRAPNGDFIAVIQNYADIYRPLGIIRLSPDGMVLSKIFPDQTVMGGTTNIITTQDGGFLLGKSRYVSLPGMTQIVIEKTDNNASFVWSTPLGLCNQSYCENVLIALQELENQEYGVVYLSSARNNSSSNQGTHQIVIAILNSDGREMRQDFTNATKLPAWVFSQADRSPELIDMMSRSVPAISSMSGYRDNQQDRIDCLIKSDNNSVVILGSRYYL
jgi:hypothetical protein